MILLIIIDLCTFHVHEMHRIDAFIETHQHSELHKSLMGLLLISIASLLVLFLEPSSQFNNGLRPVNPYDAFYGRNGEMGMGFNG